MAKFKTIFTYTIPVLAGYIFLGIAFGLLVRTGGYPIWFASIMSVIIYSGALEFAAIPLIGQAFDPLGAFILGVMLSARHLFYGIPMLKKYSNSGIIKPFLIFGLTDETFSILSTVEVPENVKDKDFYVGVTFLHYMYWNLGTLIGAFCGDLVGKKAYGLDFVITALFIVLFVEQMKDKMGIISGLVGLIITLVVLLTVGSGKMVIISMALILAILLAGRKVIDNEH